MSLVLPFPLPASGYPQAAEVQTDLDAIVADINNATTNGKVNSGAAGRLALYASSTNQVSDTYIQNTKNITLAIATQASRSANLALTIPNPGNAITAANVLLSEGAQTINGAPTFTSTVTMPTPFTLGAVSVTATGTELNYVVGVTSAIQTQLGTKAPLASPTFTGTVTVPTPFTLGAVSVTATGTELNYVAGVTSAIQTQLGTKAPTASPTFTGTATLGSDAYTVAYTDYSGTSTIVGWSAFTTKLIYYKTIGKIVYVWFSIDGTSNSTTTTFTLPFAVANTLDMTTTMGRARDNNVDLTAPGAIEIDKNTSTVNVFKDCAFGAWTASSRKIVQGQFFYHTA